LASVSVDDVPDVINVSSVEVPDVKVLKMVKRAEVARAIYCYAVGLSEYRIV
jgi:hypothetical protein